MANAGPPARLFCCRCCDIEPATPAIRHHGAAGAREFGYEERDSSELSHHQGGDDRRHRIHHPQHLGQVRRHDAPRHRSEIASGLDRRSAAAGGPRGASVTIPEEIRGHRAQKIALTSSLARKLRPRATGPIKSVHLSARAHIAPPREPTAASRRQFLPVPS